MRQRSSVVRTPAKGEDCLKRAPFSLGSVMIAAIFCHGCFSRACHSLIHAGGTSFQRALHLSTFRWAIASNVASRSIFRAMTACIAKLRASSNRCEEYVGGLPDSLGTHATTAFS